MIDLTPIGGVWVDPARRRAVVRGGAPFHAAACKPCPARAQCTTARGGRGLTLPPRELHEVLAAARAEDGQDWQQDYKRRAGIEATISQAVTITGCRRARYRGLAKTRLEHAYAAVPLNVHRLDAHWNDTPIDRTRTSHLARLDLSLRLAALPGELTNSITHRESEAAGQLPVFLPGHPPPAAVVLSISRTATRRALSRPQGRPCPTA